MLIILILCLHLVLLSGTIEFQFSKSVLLFLSIIFYKYYFIIEKIVALFLGYYFHNFNKQKNYNILNNKYNNKF